jgi:hypothetical protein
MDSQLPLPLPLVLICSPRPDLNLAPICFIFSLHAASPSHSSLIDVFQFTGYFFIFVLVLGLCQSRMHHFP